MATSEGSPLLKLPNPVELPKNGRCMFLEVSGEMRNKIYKLALTEPYGLGYHYDPAMPTRPKLYVSRSSKIKHKNGKESKKSVQEANQLKFVSRQFYQETAGLEIEYNTIHFRHPDQTHKSVLHQCLHFLVQLSPAKQDLIQRIEIFDTIQDSYDKIWDDGLDFNSFAELTDWCVAHQKTNVIWYHPRLRIGHPSKHFMRFALLLSSALRGINRCELLESHIAPLVDLELLSMGSKGHNAFTKHGSIPNLRIHLQGEWNGWSKKVLREHIYGSDDVADKKECLELMEHWAKHGI